MIIYAESIVIELNNEFVWTKRYILRKGNTHKFINGNLRKMKLKETLPELLLTVKSPAVFLIYWNYA